MRCGILSNAAGQMMLMHEGDIPDGLDYLEYNETDNTLSLIYKGGASQNTGLSITEDMAFNLFEGKEVLLAKMTDKKFTAFRKIPFVFSEM